MRIKNLEDKILENEVRINEISELRAGKIDKATKEEQPLVDEKNNLKHENRQNRAEIKKLSNELKEYVTVKNSTGFIYFLQIFLVHFVPSI